MDMELWRLLSNEKEEDCNAIERGRSGDLVNHQKVEGRKFFETEREGKETINKHSNADPTVEILWVIKVGQSTWSNHPLICVSFPLDN